MKRNSSSRMEESRAARVRSRVVSRVDKSVIALVLSDDRQNTLECRLHAPSMEAQAFLDKRSGKEFLKPNAY